MTFCFSLTFFFFIFTFVAQQLSGWLKWWLLDLFCVNTQQWMRLNLLPSSLSKASLNIKYKMKLIKISRFIVWIKAKRLRIKLFFLLFHLPFSLFLLVSLLLAQILVFILVEIISRLHNHNNILVYLTICDRMCSFKVGIEKIYGLQCGRVIKMRSNKLIVRR